MRKALNIFIGLLIIIYGPFLVAVGLRMIFDERNLFWMFYGVITVVVGGCFLFVVIDVFYKDWIRGRNLKMAEKKQMPVYCGTCYRTPDKCQCNERGGHATIMFTPANREPELCSYCTGANSDCDPACFRNLKKKGQDSE